MIPASSGGFSMLLISYRSVAGWFRVWSVCVKAQFHVQPSSNNPTTTYPLSLTHTQTHPLHASFYDFFLFLFFLLSSITGSLFGDGRGLLEAWGALMKNESTQDVAPTCTNSVTTLVVRALVMRGKWISVYEVNINLLWVHFGEGEGGSNEETGGLCFYLRDCNNKHTSATGLVASIILSTVEQKMHGSQNYTRLGVCGWLCVCVFFFLFFCPSVCLWKKRGVS